MGATWLHEVETTRPGWNLQVFRIVIPPHDPGDREAMRSPEGRATIRFG
jgi:hypothetical protein